MIALGFVATSYVSKSSLAILDLVFNDTTISYPLSHMNPPQLPTQKKGLSGCAIAGMGCLTIVIILFLGGGFLVAKFMPDLKQMAADFEKDPGKAATLMALKMNPDVEVLHVDDTKREVTFKLKSSGETTTLSFDDIEKGKFSLKNDKGEKISVDASKAQTEGVVIKGPDGQTVTAGVGASTAVPAEVPLYPGVTLQDGSVRIEKADKISGLVTGHVTDTVSKIKDHYEATLKAAGLVVQSVFQGDDQTATVTGTKNQGKTDITVVITPDQSLPGKTQITVQYKLPKP